MNSILNISEAASIAIHAMTFIAALDRETPVSTSEIAGQLDVSENHLSKVLQRLMKAGLVDARRGPKGGFLLARGADEITLLDVFEAIEGPLSVRTCLMKTRICDPGNCILGDMVHEVTSSVKQYLSSHTLEDRKEVFMKLAAVAKS